MKTAMQELIDEMTSYLEVHESPEAREVLRILKASAIRKYWKEEKEQIVDACKHGYGIAYIDGDNKNFEKAVEYYNQTFNKKKLNNII